MNLREALRLVLADVQRVYPNQAVTLREAAEYVRGHMTADDIRFLVDDKETKKAYFAILEASGDALNAELRNG